MLFRSIPEAQRVTTSRTSFRCLDLPLITACMDVGLVPLASNVFNEAKSALKGMEYAACGIPCLATPTGEYRRFVQEGETGFLCKSPREFVQRLDMLYADRKLAERLGRQARKNVRQFAIDRTVTDWEDWLGSFGHGDHADAARTLATA